MSGADTLSTARVLEHLTNKQLSRTQKSATSNAQLSYHEVLRKDLGSKARSLKPQARSFASGKWQLPAMKEDLALLEHCYGREGKGGYGVQRRIMLQPRPWSKRQLCKAQGPRQLLACANRNLDNVAVAPAAELLQPEASESPLRSKTRAHPGARRKTSGRAQQSLSCDVSDRRLV